MILQDRKRKESSFYRFTVGVSRVSRVRARSRVSASLGLGLIVVMGFSEVE